MNLHDELFERHKVLKAAKEEMQASLRQTEAELDDLLVAIWALEGTTEAEGRAMQAEAALEPTPAAVTEPEPKEQGCRDYSDGSEFDQSTLPSAEDVRGILADDASEFAEEGYAPVIEPEQLADPIWNEPESTKPEADSIAKALDHYDPKAMAERDRFNPFNIFKREGDQ